MRSVEQGASGTRRPIEPAELPDLWRLGEEIRKARTSTGLSVAECARRAQISGPYLWRLEHGQRRPRRGTLRRLAEAIASGRPCGSAAELPERFVAAAADRLATESAHRERLERRRMRRLRRGRYAIRTMHGYCPHCRRPL